MGSLLHCCTLWDFGSYGNSWEACYAAVGYGILVVMGTHGKLATLQYVMGFW
jgi:hypothetical protein